MSIIQYISAGSSGFYKEFFKQLILLILGQDLTWIRAHYEFKRI